MTKLLLGSVALAAATIGNVALAADMPVKAPIIAPVVYNWTGCYIGGNAGWKWGRFRESVDTTAGSGTIPGIGTRTFAADHIDFDGTNAGSGAWGGQVGCRWESPQHWVVGFEGDLDFTNLRATALSTAFGPAGVLIPGDYFNNRARWQSSGRVVLGRTWDRWFGYVTGGVAFTRVSMDANFLGTTTINGTPFFPASSGSDSKTLTGGTIGVGVAYALSGNWEIGAEFRHTVYQGADFGLGSLAASCAFTTAVPGGGPVCLNTTATGHKDLRTDEVLVRLNYKFDWAGPVVAKY